jgi:protein-disulfide isomerase
MRTQNSDAYWDFADYIHANKREVDGQKPADRFEAIDKMTMLQGQKHNVDAVKLQSCVKAQNEDAVRASMKEADGLGVNGTPALFINGQKIDGAVPIAEVRAALDAALKDAGEPVPAHAPSAAAPTSR